MKILQINAVFGFGSTGRNVEELHNYLKNNHIQSYVAYGEKKCEDNEEIFYVGNELDHKLHGLFSRLLGKQAYFSKRSTKKLCKKIDNIKPDVVQLHNVHANYLHFPYLMNHLKKNNIPVLLTLHDCWFFTGKCCHYTGIGCKKWESNCENCPQLKTNNKSWFFDTSNQVFSDKMNIYSSMNIGVVGVSDWIVSEAKRSILKNALFIDKIHNWIDTAKFRPVDSASVREMYGIPTSEKIILAVSQGWDENKGLCDLIKVAECFSNCRVILVGKPPENDTLPKNIILIPFVSDLKKLVEIYSVADVFVNPSHMETFGKVTAEAMACGTPVVVYENTGNKELIVPGVGECAKNLDKDDLCNKIKIILNNGKEFYKLNCVKNVGERFEMNNQLEKYVEVYRRLIELGK